MKRDVPRQQPRILPSSLSTMKRAAFTLIEVLLALSLSVVLLVAVYGAFDLYVRFASVGHDDVEQAQIARALLRRMGSDIRSVVYRPATSGSSTSSSAGSSGNSSGGSNSSGQSGSQGNSSNSTSSGSGGASSGSSGRSGSTGASGSRGSSGSSGRRGSSNSGSGSNSGSSGSGSSGSGSNSGNSSNSNSSSSDENTVVDPTAGFSSAMTGLVGDATTLVLHVARVSRQSTAQNFAAVSEGAPTNAGEEKSISYFLADAGADGLAGLVGDVQKDVSRTTGDVQGLARLEGNRLAIKIAEEQSDMNSLAEIAQVLAPEVTNLQFRYFDGVDWLDEWDSGVSQRLPIAVEITLEIRRTGKKDQKSTTLKDGPPPGDVYTTTIAIPSAEPYIPTAQ